MSANQTGMSALAEFFHSFPHYDINFEKVPAVFRPLSQEYQESLLLIAAIPVLWMLLWILVYMVYFCYFCVTCRKHRVEKSRKSARPTRWFAFIFSILSILVLMVALTGNELVHHGLENAETDMDKIKEKSEKVVLLSATILQDLDSLSNDTLAYLNRHMLTNPRLDDKARPAMTGHVTLISEAVVNAQSAFRAALHVPAAQLGAESSQLSVVMEMYEAYRRIATHSVTGFLMLTTAISLCALGSKRKVFLLACVAIFVFNLMALWVAAGFYSSLSVATADFCVNSTGYVMGRVNPGGDQITLRYYLQCDPPVNPLNSVVIAIQDRLAEAGRSLISLQASNDVLPAEVLANITSAQLTLADIKDLLLQLSSSTACVTSSKDYTSAINNVCFTAMLGSAAALGSFTAAGTFTIILVFLVHAAARYSGNRRAYFEVDSQDHDFQSRGEHNRSDNPLYYRFSQISTNEDNTRVAGASATSAAAQPSAPPRSSPPPAYQNHKDFYSTYGNNGTLDSNTRVPAVSNDLNRNSNTFRT